MKYKATSKIKESEYEVIQYLGKSMLWKEDYYLIVIKTGELLIIFKSPYTAHFYVSDLNFHNLISDYSKFMLNPELL